LPRLSKLSGSIESGRRLHLSCLKTLKGGGGNPKSPFTMGLTVNSF